MPRPPEPKVLKAWRKRIQEPQPRICWTCANYNMEGICRSHAASPPLDFAETPNACDIYIEGVPF